MNTSLTETTPPPPPIEQIAPQGSAPHSLVTSYQYTLWRWFFCYTFRPYHSWRKMPQYTFYRRLHGPGAGLTRWQWEKLLPLSPEPRSPTLQPATLQNELWALQVAVSAFAWELNKLKRLSSAGLWPRSEHVISRVLCGGSPLFEPDISGQEGRLNSQPSYKYSPVYIGSKKTHCSLMEPHLQLNVGDNPGSMQWDIFPHSYVKAVVRHG
jgi:hypothetical protein